MRIIPFTDYLFQELREQLAMEQNRSRTLLARLEQGEAVTRHSLTQMQLQYETKMRVSIHGVSCNSH